MTRSAPGLSCAQISTRARPLTRGRALPFLRSFLFIFLVAFVGLPRLAQAQGAAALAGTSSISWDALASCATRDRLEARELTLLAVSAACEDQNVRLAASGHPRCPAHQCLDRIVYRDGRAPLPVDFELGFRAEDRAVWLSFRLRLDGRDDGGAGWRLACRSPFDFLAWNGRLVEAEGFFDAALSALPRCMPLSGPRDTSHSPDTLG